MNSDPLAAFGSIDATWLLLSLIPNGIGFVLFVYGRKQARTPHLLAGIVLMLYPMLATTTLTLIAGGLLTTIGLWYAVRMGW